LRLAFPEQARREASSCSEEKEAKRLFPSAAPRQARKRSAKLTQVCWFFFTKKNGFLLPAG
jgi:hypothetical protein